MDGLLEEYRTLRDEIRHNSEITARTFIFTVTVTVTVIAAGLTIGFWAIFLSPFAIIVPVMYFLASQLESTTRIASYIRVRLEPKLEGLNWQTDWFRLREKKLISHRHKYTSSITGLYQGLSVVCLLLSWIYLFSKDHDLIHVIILSITSVIVVVLITLATLSIRNAFSSSFRDRYNKAWLDLDK
jgi:hypothetical protein